MLADVFKLKPVSMLTLTLLKEALSGAAHRQY